MITESPGRRMEAGFKERSYSRHPETCRINRMKLNHKIKSGIGIVCQTGNKEQEIFLSGQAYHSPAAIRINIPVSLSSHIPYCGSSQTVQRVRSSDCTARKADLFCV